MTLQSLNPIRNVLVVAPAGFVSSMDSTGSFPESRHRSHVLLRQRIPTLSYSNPVLRRLHPSSGQAYGRKSTQTDIAPTSFNRNPQDP